MERPEFSYIGRKPCGCVVAAMVDNPDDAKETAKEVAKWIKLGLTVERVTHEYVRQNFTTNCPHAEKQLSLFGA